MNDMGLARLIDLVKSRAIVFAEGDGLKVRGYDWVISWDYCLARLDTGNQTAAQANADLCRCDAGFDPEALSKGKRIEVWSTTEKAKGEAFALHVLLDADGHCLGHRIVRANGVCCKAPTAPKRPATPAKPVPLVWAGAGRWATWPERIQYGGIIYASAMPGRPRRPETEPSAHKG
jgi:hypothetical protein